MLDSVYAALTRRDIDAALSGAQAAVSAQPDNIDALKALALAHRLAGDTPSALTAIDQAIARAPHRADLHLVRAGTALGQGDPVRAGEALSAAVTSDPNSLGAYLMGIHLAFGQGKIDEADRQLKLAQRVDLNHPHVIAAEGLIAMARGEVVAAQRLLNLALGDLPNDPLVLSMLGMAYRAGGNHAFAEAALRRALEIQPNAIGLRWALIDSLQRQGSHDEALDLLDALLDERPDDVAALALSGDIALRAGQPARAAAAYRELVTLLPYDAAAMDRLLTRLSQGGMRQEAMGILDAALLRHPAEPLLWHCRLQTCGSDLEAGEDVLRRWRDARPGDNDMLMAWAEFQQQRGRHEDAAVLAANVLASQPEAIDAEVILLRAELRRDPASALPRIERLLATDRARDLQPTLLFWRALMNDALAQPAAAVADWQEAWRLAPARAPLREPSGVPVSSSPEASDVQARLLWSPPGGRVQEVLAMLASVPETQVLQDRFGSSPRPDGFGPPRDDDSLADPAGWRHLVETVGGDPVRCIDWLPYWDERLASALPGAHLVAVIADPRDLLLGWLAFGAPWPVAFPGPEAAADWLIKALTPIAQRLERNDAQLLLIRGEALHDSTEEVAEWLRSRLTLSQSPDPAAVLPTRRGAGGLPTAFPPGHWRVYADALAPAFAQLAPLAVRLGYPA